MLFRRTRSITPAEAAAASAAGELDLVDVREPGEVRAEPLAGARNIPLGELGRRLGELDPARPLAFVCRSGARSAGATRMAAKAGLDAVNVRGGMLAWTRAGVPADPKETR
ncbi:MAG: rhodanese-like domain-containing protein [Solirubrobacterales bacterium]|nr:rhodanese-like domain-containing protein [Solirubrobacterales bacterium]